MSDGGQEAHQDQKEEGGALPSRRVSKRGAAGTTNRALWETVETVAIALVLAILIRQFVVESFVVHGVSMLPNLQNGEHLLVSKFIYDLEPPRIGEVIVFLPPPAAHSSQDYIKRVIAVGGDTVAMRDGQVYVNDKLQQEVYLPARYRDTATFPTETVPRGDVFVLGDHRRVSQDSRYFGFVPIRNIRGEAFFAWWPLQSIGPIG